MVTARATEQAAARQQGDSVVSAGAGATTTARTGTQPVGTAAVATHVQACTTDTAEGTHQLMAATGTGTAAWLRAGEELGHPALAGLNETLLAHRPFALIKIQGEKSSDCWWFDLNPNNIWSPNVMGCPPARFAPRSGPLGSATCGIQAIQRHPTPHHPCLPPSSTTMAWNPAKYLTFGQARLRPALDLLAQARAVAPATAARIVVRVPQVPRWLLAGALRRSSDRRRPGDRYRAHVRAPMWRSLAPSCRFRRTWAAAPAT